MGLASKDCEDAAIFVNQWARGAENKTIQYPDEDGAEDVQAIPPYQVKAYLKKIRKSAAGFSTTLLRLVLNPGCICTERSGQGGGNEGCSKWHRWPNVRRYGRGSWYMAHFCLCLRAFGCATLIGSCSLLGLGGLSRTRAVGTCKRLVGAGHHLVERRLAARLLWRWGVRVVVVHLVPGVWRRWRRPLFVNTVERARQRPLIVDIVKRVIFLMVFLIVALRGNSPLKKRAKVEIACLERVCLGRRGILLGEAEWREFGTTPCL
jgi:hypothetical protein